MCVYNLFIWLRIYKAIYFVVMMKHAYSYRKSQSLILKVTMMIKIGQGGCHGDVSLLNLPNTFMLSSDIPTSLANVAAPFLNMCVLYICDDPALPLIGLLQEMC